LTDPKRTIPSVVDRNRGADVEKNYRSTAGDPVLAEGRRSRITAHPTPSVAERPDRRDEGNVYERRSLTLASMEDRFRRTKRVVVVVEVVLGSFVLAAVTAAISQVFISGGQFAAGSTDDFAGSLAIALLVGVVLFVDGLRRGRRWM
jgi:hypothetical protein